MTKNVLITGVSSGIGLVTAKYLAQRGYFIYGSVRKAEDAQQVKSALGKSFFPLLFDVRDQEAIDAAVLELDEHLNGAGLHALINNAGVAVSGPVEHVPVSDFEYQFDVNVLGLIRTTQAFLPYLGADQSKNLPAGRIVNISSVSGLLTRPFMGPYSASKHAVEAITSAMRKELDVAHGIQVISINPGPIKTPIWQKAREADNPYMDTAYGPYMRNKEKAIAQIESIAIDTVEVAKAIHQSLEQQKPFIRKIITAKKALIKLAAFVMPLRMVDNMFKKQLKALAES